MAKNTIKVSVYLSVSLSRLVISEHGSDGSQAKAQAVFPQIMSF
jgi:hypothetical protein